MSEDSSWTPTNWVEYEKMKTQLESEIRAKIMEEIGQAYAEKMQEHRRNEAGYNEHSK